MQPFGPPDAKKPNAEERRQETRVFFLPLGARGLVVRGAHGYVAGPRATEGTTVARTVASSAVFPAGFCIVIFVCALEGCVPCEADLACRHSSRLACEFGRFHAEGLLVYRVVYGQSWGFARLLWVFARVEHQGQTLNVPL